MPQFPASIDLATLDGANGFRLDGIDAEDVAGFCVSNAGDVNGDGFGDVIVGAIRTDSGGDDDVGESYVVFGKAGGFAAAIDLGTLDGADGFRLDGIDDEDRAGYGVSSAGDVNGDGFGDLIVGAPGVNSGDGECYVVFGKATGFGSSFDLAALDGSNGFSLSGHATFEGVGRFVAGGDINGDGFGDLVLSGRDGEFLDPYQFYYFVDARACVVFGKASGFAANINLATLNGNNGFVFRGQTDYFGNGDSGLGSGDFNGDGFDDFILGRPHGSFSNGADGSAYVVFGKAGGFSATLSFGALDGSNGFELEGTAFQADDVDVGSAGDVNGDGIEDMLVGCTYDTYSAPGPPPGLSFVLFGKTSGFGATFDIGTVDGTNGFRIGGIDIGDDFGGAVSGAGDVNGDGFADLIVGAQGADPGSDSRAGETHVLFGKAGGFTADFGLADLDGENGFRLDGVDAGDRSGHSVSGAGDVNGDGFDDLIVGAPQGFGYGSPPGKSYVIFGREPQVAVMRTGTAAANWISGGVGDDTLSGLGGADELFGRGGDDTLDGGSGGDAMAGGAGDDFFVVRNAGDSASELANQGTDEVNTSVDFTLGSHVENLSMVGAAAIAGTGNNLGNTMTGNQGDNILSGLGKSDRLDGKGGADRMIGGGGNEIYFVDNAGDGVIELAGEGIDQARAAVTYSLLSSPHVENLLLTRPDDIDGTGNHSNNVIQGGNGDNVLRGHGGGDRITGGLGRDTLIGDAGGDRFVYTSTAQSAPSDAARDRINDFESGTDTIDVAAIDANRTAAGSQAFVIDDNGSFSAGEIKIEALGTGLLLSFNTDADAAAEMQIQLKNIGSVVAGDFIL